MKFPGVQLLVLGTLLLTIRLATPANYHLAIKTPCYRMLADTFRAETQKLSAR